MLSVCISGGPEGSLHAALAMELAEYGYMIVPDSENQPCANVAISVAGKIIIKDPAAVTSAESAQLYHANYLYPRRFLERNIALWRKQNMPGLGIVVGSVAAKFGNAWAEDYAAQKAAIDKYVQLRARTVREHGIRLMMLNFGAFQSKFWDQVVDDGRGIVPNMERALSLADVVETIVALLRLPERVVIREAVVVSVDYQ